MFLPSDIVLIIAGYAEEYKLKKGIDEKKLVDDWLCINNNAFDYLRKQFGEEKGVLSQLSENENSAAVLFLLKHRPNHINWHCLSANSNPIAVEYLLQHPEKIDYKAMSDNKNPKAIEFLLQHPDKICLETLHSNPCDLAVEYVLELAKKKSHQGIGFGIIHTRKSLIIVLTIFTLIFYVDFPVYQMIKLWTLC